MESSALHNSGGPGEFQFNRRVGDNWVADIPVCIGAASGRANVVAGYNIIGAEGLRAGLDYVLVNSGPAPSVGNHVAVNAELSYRSRPVRVDDVGTARRS